MRLHRFPSPHRLRPVVLLAGLLAGPAALAQPSPALDRASLWLGGYYARSDTTLTAQSPDSLLGGGINLERDLGLPDHEWTPRARLNLLLGDSQGFSFDFYRYDRSNTRQLSGRIDYRGNVYDARARVRGELRFDFGSAAYRWWFGRGNDALGVGLGAGYYSVDGRVSGQASVNGISGQASSRTRAHAWAPTLQLGWRHLFNTHWRLYMDASGVKKGGGRLYGHIYNADVGLQWQPTGHLGLAFEYDVNRIRLHQTHHAYRDSLDLKLDGPSVFVTFDF